MNQTEKIFELLEKQITSQSKYHKITVLILFILLCISICGNVYMATQEKVVEFTIEDTTNTNSEITQSNG